MEEKYMVMFGKLTNCLPENTYVILKYTNNHHTKNIVSMQKKKKKILLKLLNAMKFPFTPVSSDQNFSAVVHHQTRAKMKSIPISNSVV